MKTISSFLQIIMITVFLLIAHHTTVLAVVVPAGNIVSAIIDSLENRAEELGIEIEASVRNTIDVEVGDVQSPKMEVIIPVGRKLEARVPVHVEFSDGSGDVVKRFRFMTQIKVFKTVVVACSEIGRGESLDSFNTEMKKADITGLDNYFVTMLPIEGMQAKRLIKPGVVLTNINISPIPVVNRGDHVTITVSIGNVRAVAEGVARQDGGIGETIKVYNDMTRTTIECVIIDDKNVRSVL